MMSYRKTPRLPIMAALFALPLLFAGCAATRSPEAGSPARSAAGPRYPVVLEIDESRHERALLAWNRIAGLEKGSGISAPPLHPILSTVQSLKGLPSTLRLPDMGSAEERSEQTTHEALRRFIGSESDLLGVELSQISLVEIKDGPDGIKEAHYIQRPFQYPLRGGYGQVEIAFREDYSVVNLFSPAIPVSDRLRRTVNELDPVIPAADVGSRIAGRSVTFTDPVTKETQTIVLPVAEHLTLGELVIYPLPRKGDADAGLDLHLAWEVVIKEGAEVPVPGPRMVYIDANDGEILPPSDISRREHLTKTAEGGILFESKR